VFRIVHIFTLPRNSSSSHHQDRIGWHIFAAVDYIKQPKKVFFYKLYVQRYALSVTYV
jgi:hypothetical protein